MNCLSGLRPFSLALFCALPLLAQSPASDSQPLVPIAKLWVTVKYFHPSIASRPIHWDNALVAALPALRAAKTDEELKAAVTSLLAPLHDPFTAVLDAAAPAASSSEPVAPQRSWIHHGLPSALPSAARFYQAFTLKPAAPAEFAVVPLSPTLRARVRLSEPAPETSAVPTPLPDADYAATPYPSVELRILSAFRIWGVLHNFFAYKDLMDVDWDAAFAEALPKFIAASDARAYHLAVAELIGRLSDSNSTVHSAELDRYFGEASPGIQIRLVEQRPVVTAIFDPSARTAGLNLGDIISTLDGQKVTERFKQQAIYVSASTPQGLSAALVERLLNGPDASSAELTIVAPTDERPRSLTLKRALSWPAPPGEPPVRILKTNIGYADLTRLPPKQIDNMFQQLAHTTAIIFDARGPIANLTAGIASCLARQPEVNTAIVTGPLSLEPDLPRPGLSTTTSSYFSIETVGNTCAAPYKGKTVMLIDERTIGNAEHLGLALEVANGTEFLGTPSAGADSDVTEFTAPGGIRIRFSGTDVRHGNAGPIQRMGLQPSLALAPKIAAIRAGRDVVLEKALEYLHPGSTQAKERTPQRSRRGSLLSSFITVKSNVESSNYR